MEPTQAALQAPGAFDKHLVGAVDHDLADAGVAQQPLQRSQADSLVEDVVDQSSAINLAGQVGFGIDQFNQQQLRFMAQLSLAELAHILATQVDRMQQFAMHRSPPLQPRSQPGWFGPQ